MAAFIGSPAMNLYDAVLGEDARSIKLGSQQVDLPDTVTIKRPALRSYIGKDVTPDVRPWLDAPGPPKPPAELPFDGRISRPRKAVAPMWMSEVVMPDSIRLAMDRASSTGIEYACSAT